MPVESDRHFSCCNVFNEFISVTLFRPSVIMAFIFVYKGTKAFKLGAIVIDGASILREIRFPGLVSCFRGVKSFCSDFLGYTFML